MTNPGQWLSLPFLSARGHRWGAVGISVIAIKVSTAHMNHTEEHTMPPSLLCVAGLCEHTLGRPSTMRPAVHSANAHFPSVYTPRHHSESITASNTKGASIRETDELVNKRDGNGTIMSYCIITECKSRRRCYLQFHVALGPSLCPRNYSSCWTFQEGALTAAKTHSEASVICGS